MKILFPSNKLQRYTTNHMLTSDTYFDNKTTNNLRMSPVWATVFQSIMKKLWTTQNKIIRIALEHHGSCVTNGSGNPYLGICVRDLFDRFHSRLKSIEGVTKTK